MVSVKIIDHFLKETNHYTFQYTFIQSVINETLDFPVLKIVNSAIMIFNSSKNEGRILIIERKDNESKVSSGHYLFSNFSVIR